MPREQETKRFAPEELAKALGFEKGMRVIGFRLVDWCEKWEIAASSEGCEGDTIQQFPQQCYNLNDYANAYREYVEKMFEAKEKNLPVPVPPEFSPATVDVLVTELVKARRELGKMTAHENA